MCTGFFMTINLIEGKSINEAVEDLRMKFLPTMKMNWKLWIPASFINFQVMPIQY